MLVKLYRVEDWEAVYFKGKCITQGHLVELEDVLPKLGIDFKSEYIEDANDLDDFGNSFPHEEKDLLKWLNDKK